MDWVYYIVVFGILGLFSGTVIWALWWAVRGGQMSHFQRGATSIFDDDEPVGKVTDAFPGEERKAQRQRNAEDRTRQEHA